MLIANPKGNYSFLRGISPYSAGAVAATGYQVEHATLIPAVPLRAGFEVVTRHLAALGRPRHALCGMELRSPRPFTFQGFNQFNMGYIQVLKSWDIFVDGVNPVARTNVAPEFSPPPEPMLYGFSYTVAAKDAPQTFVVAGAGELPEGSLDPHEVVRRGETSPDALVEKVRFVMALMTSRLKGLGAGLDQVTTTEVYTVHDIHPFLAREILAPMGQARQRGLVWHFARPPIESIEFEMDVRGCRREIVLRT